MEETQNQAAPVNADIEAFLMNAGSLEIELQFGLNEYFNYLEDIRLLGLGFKFKDLGISERRHATVSKLILASDSTYMVSAWDLKDPEFRTPKDSIALLKLSGVMRSQSGISSRGIDGLINDLRFAYSDENISGVIIETESGGGESIAGTKLKSALGERSKPVVGFAHMAASAAYRALSGADEIIASGDSAEFGSIGTMISVDRKMLQKYGSRVADFYGSGAPGKNADFRAALSGDFSAIQTRVDGLTEAFQNEIRRDRDLRGSAAKIAETVNGSMWSAIEAKQRGLIDMVGNMQTAVKRIKSLRGSKYK